MKKILSFAVLVGFMLSIVSPLFAQTMAHGYPGDVTTQIEYPV